MCVIAENDAGKGMRESNASGFAQQMSKTPAEQSLGGRTAPPLSAPQFSPNGGGSFIVRGMLHNETEFACAVLLAVCLAGCPPMARLIHIEH
jgi:hypothetical protein